MLDGCTNALNKTLPLFLYDSIPAMERHIEQITIKYCINSGNMKNVLHNKNVLLSDIMRLQVLYTTTCVVYVFSLILFCILFTAYSPLKNNNKDMM